MYMSIQILPLKGWPLYLFATLKGLRFVTCDRIKHILLKPTVSLSTSKRGRQRKHGGFFATLDIVIYDTLQQSHLLRQYLPLHPLYVLLA